METLFRLNLAGNYLFSLALRQSSVLSAMPKQFRNAYEMSFNMVYSLSLLAEPFLCPNRKR
jgi:hypothetical protein